MKKITGLNEPLVDLAEKPLQDERGEVLMAKHIISGALGRGRSDDPVRAIDIALKIRNADGELVLDDADVEVAKKALLNDQGWSDIVRAAGLRCLGTAEPVAG